MKYFKNTELAKIHHVSEKTVRNWIKSSKSGKNKIKLYQHNGYTYIANTSQNNAFIEQLVAKGKKYKNSRGFKTVKPKPAFYKTYTVEQILHIISSLVIHREIPTQYTYADGGAAFWDNYAQRLYSEPNPNIINQTIELLSESTECLSRFVNQHPKINIVDLGPGNGLPIKNTLEHFVQSGRVNKYIAIDCSDQMLDILEKNVRGWFGDKLSFQRTVRDFSRQPFDDLFLDDYTNDEKDVPINVVFFLGNTLNNFRSPRQALHNINESLGPNDILVYSGYLDTPKTRRYFDFNVSTGSQVNQKIRSELILGLLGIEDSLYDIETKYNEQNRERSICMVPKFDILIEFELSKGTRSIEISKGDPILIWRGRHNNSVETISQFDESGFEPAHLATTKDRQYLLLTSKIKLQY